MHTVPEEEPSSLNAGGVKVENNRRMHLHARDIGAVQAGWLSFAYVCMRIF